MTIIDDFERGLDTARLSGAESGDIIQKLMIIKTCYRGFSCILS